MARKKRGRDISGILLFDKPVGASSNHVLQRVRRLFGAAKAGHTGSLDPLASGMLPICFGEATKFSQYLLNSDKAYQVTAKLGETTTTADAEGEVLQKRDINCTRADLELALNDFRGETMQVPSMFSALKHQGQPLYKLARQGIEVERKARPIRIDHLEITGFDSESFSLNVECSKGTYIRNLVEDIGEKLGCGAHVTVLRRTWVAHFNYDELVSFEDLESIAPVKNSDGSANAPEDFAQLDKLLLPMDEALVGYPEVRLSADLAFYFLRGQAINVAEKEFEHAEVIKVYDDNENFIGVGKLDESLMLAPRRLIAS